MKNIKLYLIGFAILFVASSVVTVNLQSKKIKRQKAEIERVQNNNFQLMSENRSQTTLYLKEKEVTGKLLTQRDSLAKALKIRPKYIDKIIYLTTTEKDTVVKEVFVSQIANYKWAIADTGKCFVWKADVSLSDNNLNVKRTLFNYSDSTTFVYYRNRPNKFLFFNYGKRTNFVQISSECGQTATNTFEFLHP